jgi:hypothetical protein
MKTNSELKKSTIDFLNKNHNASLNNKNVRFSSINKSKNVWWFNIPMKKFNEEVNLFLFDENKTIWINLPKNFCLNLTENFRIRVDNKKNDIDIEICSDKTDSNFLKDIKSISKNFDFSKYVKMEIS